LAGADLTRVRRKLLLTLPLAAGIALFGATGQSADGRMTLPHDVGQAVHAVPQVAQAQAATKRRQPLRFTLVDTAGAVVRRWPGGPVAGTIAPTTPLGAHSWSWAFTTTRDGRWAKVGLTWKPNGRTGWIRLAGRRVAHTKMWVQADLSRRQVRLMRGRRTLVVFKAAVGAPASPTPTGRFFVTDLVATGDASGPFGWFAFGLSGHQPNLPAGWSGGDQLAIHGTNAPSSIGTAASAGCLRVSSGALGTLRHYLRLGTPVVIHP
jgi:lipoprotein-anchoring transpeptidase ErfK/SrfK